MKILSNLFTTVGCLLLMTQTSHAYLDPSVVTYAIQAVAGICIAVGAGLGIYFRKAKTKVSEKLHIDENAKKETEEDVVIFESKDNDTLL